MKKIGAWYKNNQCHFCLWAPTATSIQLKNIDTNELLSLSMDDSGYWSIKANFPPGTNYKYVINKENEYPDPTSFCQPNGVHGPSQTINHNEFKWSDKNWQPSKIEDMIIYELHPGTFTDKGDLLSISSKFDHLKELGINTIELMPIAQFPGMRNWGYDGAYPFAVQNSYGGPNQLKSLVNLCHLNGFTVILDVVYNHLGPEGNYLPCFAPYFTNKYNTPWGDAINFDDDNCEGVRNYFISNAIYWLKCFHIDALRLDAVHGIFDDSSKHILAEISEHVTDFNLKNNRSCYLIAESDLNDSNTIRPIEQKGHGINAQWNDDFHHALHTLLTKETAGYYQDFESIDTFTKAYKNNFVYDGTYSKFRGKNHGNNCSDLAPSKFIVFNQNHDQVGNRMLGERLISLSDFEIAKSAAAFTLLSPSVPMLFMGEEYGEENPFLYFIDHGDQTLIEAVKKGRLDEFKDFIETHKILDVHSEETFLKSKIDWQKLSNDKHKEMFNWYKELIKIRKENPVFASANNRNISIHYNSGTNTIFIFREKYNKKGLIIFNLSGAVNSVEIPDGNWNECLSNIYIRIFLSK